MLDDTTDDQFILQCKIFYIMCHWVLIIYYLFVGTSKYIIIYI